MKKLLSLTAAALLLITAGCGRSNAPPASASSGTPSVSAPITEPTVESSDDTTPTVQKDEAAVKPQSSRRLDDSRIIPLYSERFTYTDPNGIEDTYFYEVPQIDDDTEDAKHINEMINYRYGYLVERAQDARSRNDFIDTGFIIWVSNWNGPVLSLQVTSSDTLFNHDVGSYHYNFATGQELTNLDLLEYMGYTDSAKTLPMYTPAGSGMYWTDVQVDPNKRQASGQVLHGQDEWFTCDVTATGKVTVRALTDYVSSDGAVTYQDMKEWYELGDQTEFTVNGCYGNYVKMLMTSVGQDYAPYVFLLTEDGNVEYIDVISGAQCGTMANGGPLYGVNEIVKFEIGTAYDADFEAEYTTVYAVSRNNEKFNLVEAMHNADPMELSSLIGSYVSDYTGTWFEICEDQPNFYIGEYRNENREPATWDSGITYLGMDHRGWICSISLYRMDLGRAQRETVAMMPTDYGGFYVRHIGGESLLNLPKDESVWFEMTNE